MSVSESLGIYQHVEDAAVSSEREDYTRTPRINAWEKRGIVDTLAMVASSLDTLLAVAFLAFIEYGASQASQGDLPPTLWLKILGKQWMTRAVTVCAILIRVASSTQMGVFAAVIAAIILETTGVIAE
jgi:hypothetical protein